MPDHRERICRLLTTNRVAFERHVDEQGDLDEGRRAALYDPQTSGGLLLLVPANRTPALLAAVAGARAIGRALPAGPKPLIVRG